jgi:hypothetical protein
LQVLNRNGEGWCCWWRSYSENADVEIVRVHQNWCVFVWFFGKWEVRIGPSSLVTVWSLESHLIMGWPKILSHALYNMNWSTGIHCFPPKYRGFLQVFPYTNSLIIW